MSKLKTTTQNSKVKVIFLGTPDFVKPIKDELAEHFQLVHLLNQADLAVVASYGRILTKDELNSPKFGCINVHPSLLPKYRGPSPIQAAILNGDKVTGITIIKMDEKVDHGPILWQEEIDLSISDNFDILSKKIFHHAAQILPQIIGDFVAGKIVPKPQDHSKATFTKTLARQDGYFDICSPPSPQQLDRMIRAYYPWPGAWTRFSLRSHLDKGETLVKFLPGQKLQVEGGRPMSYKDFVNGYPDLKKVISKLAL